MFFSALLKERKVRDRESPVASLTRDVTTEEKFEQQAARLEDLEEAITALRADTIDIMRTGGKYTPQQIAKRIEAETDRRQDLEAIMADQQKETWSGAFDR